MKSFRNLLIAASLSFTVGGCGVIGGVHTVVISPPDYISIDGPLNFEQSSSDSRELRYIISDTDKYEVNSIDADNCSASDQGNGYFSISNVRSDCTVKFVTNQKRYDVEITENGQGISRVIDSAHARDYKSEISVLAMADYNTERVDEKAQGCDIISDTSDPILTLSNFESDCKLMLTFAEKEELVKTINLSLRVDHDFLTYYMNENVYLRVANGWSSILIDRATVTGHLYGIQENGNRRLLTEFSRTFKNIPGAEAVESRLYSARKPDGPLEIKKYEFEVLSVRNCSFSLWSTSDCTDIVGRSDSFAISVEADVLIAE